MAGSLREALEEAQEKHTEEVQETVAETTETVDEITKPVEDVVESSEEIVNDKPAVSDVEKQEETNTELESAPAPTPYDNAPASWKGEAKGVWADLPEKARREVIRRERMIERTLHDTAQARQVAEEFIGVANQYDARLKDWGTTPVAAFKTFMDADRSLSTGPMSSRAAAIANIIKEYNIDIGALDSALAGATPDPLLDVDGRVQALVQQQMAPFREMMATQEQAKTQQIVSVIDGMANNPDFPYFEEVREDMADLIEINMRRGVAVSLEDAYKKIVGYTGLNSPAQSMESVRKAKAAAVSVSGSPAAVTAAGNPADLRGTILAALEK